MKQKSNLQTTVEEILENAGEEVQKQFFWSEINENTKWDEDFVTEFRQVLSSKGITFEHEDNFGGEGQGEDYWSVYSFTQGKEKVYVQFQGWYQSYNGSEYTEFFFVEPKEVTRVEFFKV